MKLSHFRFNPRRGFTLVEMLIVVTIMSMLAALTMGGYTYAMRSSKRRISTGTFAAIKLALDRYETDFGEFPEPAGSDETVEILPGKSYNVSGAACLYQALTGDGYDAIKGVGGSSGSSDSSAQSDGKTEGAEEINNMKLAEIPPTIFTKRGSTYFIIDGFGRPFQYIKAAAPTAANPVPEANTINSTYDLWSYSEDEVNTTKKSIETLENTQLSAKWIKNW